MSDKEAIKIKRALLSVSDKTELLTLADALVKHGVKLISTGGTARSLREAGYQTEDVSEVTGFPEILDGRVKTLHPKVHGGLLARREIPAHQEALKEHDIEEIDLLVVNLYQFENAIASDAREERCIEEIDIGGPAMIRAASKNFAHLCVLTDPSQYQEFIAHFEAEEGSTSRVFRKKLAHAAFSKTARYDAAIANWMEKEFDIATPPEKIVVAKRVKSLRYGENPHQSAALYQSGEASFGWGGARLLQGKELSYNNINDGDAALRLISEFADQENATCAIIKHANPCGVAQGKSALEAYQKALRCDPVSAFGGIVAFHGVLDGEAALAVCEIFTEVVLASEISREAKDIFAKKPNLRLLEVGDLGDARQSAVELRQISGGFLIQESDHLRLDPRALRVVTSKSPSKAELADLVFAFEVAKHVKSNAIVYAKDLATVGIGAGQMSRVDSVRIAYWKALEATALAKGGAPLTEGSVLASDAFFPFADGLREAAKAGVRAVIQPGGSIKDQEVIAAADALGIAMVFTDHRHFKH